MFVAHWAYCTMGAHGQWRRPDVAFAMGGGSHFTVDDEVIWPWVSWITESVVPWDSQVIEVIVPWDFCGTEAIVPW